MSGAHWNIQGPLVRVQDGGTGAKTADAARDNLGITGGGAAPPPPADIEAMIAAAIAPLEARIAALEAAAAAPAA